MTKHKTLTAEERVGCADTPVTAALEVPAALPDWLAQVVRLDRERRGLVDDWAELADDMAVEIDSASEILDALLDAVIHLGDVAYRLRERRAARS